MDDAIRLPTLSLAAGMSGACFVGRTELLAWLNALCATELTRVEQASSGAVACQVVDALYPGQMPMSRVDWTAARPHDCLGNYKLLQQSLAALKIDKHIPVDKLVRGKCQDNLAFLQWLKALYDRHEWPRQPYDALARRARGKGGAQYNKKLCGVAAVESRTSTPVKKRATADSTLRRRSSRLCAAAAADVEEDEEFAAVLEKMESLKIKSEGLTEEKEALVKQINELHEEVYRTEEERDFYYHKLLAIEELVHDAELSKTTSAQTNLLGLSVLDVLFATSEDEGEEKGLPF
ncbi:Microtubule-associated protein RP/EB member 1 [Phytophthora pseudosyringae]|uniref:Microtubule-associated protein RP/EB member 1 n=1 Tax=Phytophthora pseudosyringae TaxID=221518 RepID=A0A8T1VSJ2_9STRA|nr:Microtubule-associated protein RP/EB member 1 [Phytophthora pseudosyringae]